MRIFDLGPKLDGMSAFEGRGINSVQIGAALFEDREGDGQKQAVARLRSGETSLTGRNKIALADYFNNQIGQVTGANAPSERVGPIGADWWDRPLDEFFQGLEEAFPHETMRLAHAHAAIVESFTGFDQYRDREVPLALGHAGGELDRGRFPINAVPVDALKLPSVQFTPGERMTIDIRTRIERPSNGWLFYVRNPDLGGVSGVVARPIWSQKPGDLIRWHPSPFSLPPGFNGALPGFPTSVGKLEGHFTAYLLIEDVDAMGVRRCLEHDTGMPWMPAGPTYEPTLHMIAVGRTLFQKGNVGKGVTYRPPMLLVRRYTVRQR